MMKRLLPVAGVILLCALSTTAQDENDKEITLLGLGGMGTAILKCFVQHGYTVHAWNRGETNRVKVQNMNLSAVIVHDNIHDAIQATHTTMLVINSEPNLATVVDLVESTKNSFHKHNHTIINFVNHEPFAAKHLEEKVSAMEINHLAGSIFGVPSTICTPAGVVLVSADERNSKQLQELTPSLQVLGSIETFPDDIGYGSLIVVGLIQMLYFGMTGYELSLLVLLKYGATEAMVERFIALAQQIATSYFPMFFKTVSKNILSGDFTRSYVPAADLLALLEMHKTFFHKMGIVEDIYNNIYVKYLQKTVQKDADTGVSAAVQHYSTDGFVLEGAGKHRGEKGAKEEL
jgi:3-hydroxyisobutyrate dehydrogenase-like beta-hydroxyacid dehydrogenase